MKKTYLFGIAATFFALHSCTKYDAHGNEILFEELYKANWILGEWQLQDSLGVLTETWTQIDDSTYTGTTMYVKDEKDTIHFEKMELMQNEDLLIYSSIVKGENGNQAVMYRLVEDTDSTLVFENKKHDYPQKIRYQKEDIDNSIQIVVYGKQKNKEKTDSYLLKAVTK